MLYAASVYVILQLPGDGCNPQPKHVATKKKKVFAVVGSKPACIRQLFGMCVTLSIQKREHLEDWLTTGKIVLNWI
jgi:hypothetical protein